AMGTFFWRALRWGAVNGMLFLATLIAVQLVTAATAPATRATFQLASALFVVLLYGSFGTVFAAAIGAVIGVTLGALDIVALRVGNSWNDSFAGGAVHGKVPTSYRVFDSPRSKALRATTVDRTEHFFHNGHWMVDIRGGGAPNGIYEGSAKDFFTGPNNGGG